nr:hypothetical protein [Okeania sp. SIO2C9]
MTRQAHAQRAWAAIERFYRNSQANVAGKKAVRPRDDGSSLAERAPTEVFPNFLPNATQTKNTL